MAILFTKQIESLKAEVVELIQTQQCGEVQNYRFSTAAKGQSIPNQGPLTLGARRPLGRTWQRDDMLRLQWQNLRICQSSGETRLSIVLSSPASNVVILFANRPPCRLFLPWSRLGRLSATRKTCFDSEKLVLSRGLGSIPRGVPVG